MGYQLLLIYQNLKRGVMFLDVLESRGVGTTFDFGFMKKIVIFKKVRTHQKHKKRRKTRMKTSTLNVEPVGAQMEHARPRA